MMFPLVVHTLDLIVSGVGISIVKAGQNDEPLAAMERGYMVRGWLHGDDAVGSWGVPCNHTPAALL